MDLRLNIPKAHGDPPLAKLTLKSLTTKQIQNLLTLWLLILNDHLPETQYQKNDLFTFRNFS